MSRTVGEWGKLKTGLAALVAGIVCLSAGIAFAAGHGKLSFVGTKTQGIGGVDGIASPGDVAVSRDGRSLYAVGVSSNAIATFKRNAHTGKLKFVNAKFDGQGGVDGMEAAESVTVAPDGRSVYVTAPGDHALAIFKRNRHNGKLRFVDAKFDGQGGVTHMNDPWAVAVSADNKSVYVTNDDSPGAVLTFKRNRPSGKLRFVNAKVESAGGVTGMDDSEGVAASGDSRNVYVTGEGDSSLATFTRNRHSGKLRFVNAKFDGHGGVEGLAEAYEPVVSGNGKNLYVTASADVASAITTFKRNRHNGKLRFVQAKFDSAKLPLANPFDVAASRDGRNVYVSFYNHNVNSGLDTFKRNRHSGKLTFVNSKRDEMGGLTGIGGLWRVAISPDDKSLYTADYGDSSVGIFKRHR